MSTNTHPSTTNPSVLGRIGYLFKHAWESIRPGPHAWKGPALGLLAVSVFFILVTDYAWFQAQPRVASFLLGSAEFIGIAAVAGVLPILLIALLKKIPVFYGWALGLSLALLYVSFFIGGTISLPGFLVVILGVVGVASLLGAAMWVLARGGWRAATGIQRAITLLGLVLGLGSFIAGAVWFLGAGHKVETPPNAAP